MSKATVIKTLEKFGIKVVGDSEEFDGQKGGLWLSAETFKGTERHLDYWNDNFNCGVSQILTDELEKMGWFIEFNDPGTAMAWKL